MFLMGMVVGACMSMVLIALWDWYRLNKQREEMYCSYNSSYRSSLEKEVDKENREKNTILAKEMAESFARGEWTVTYTPKEYTPYMPFDKESVVFVGYAVCEEHYPSLRIDWHKCVPAGAKMTEGKHFIWEDCLYGKGSGIYIRSSNPEDKTGLYSSVLYYEFIEHLKHLKYVERQQRQTDVVSKYLKGKK